MPIYEYTCQDCNRDSELLIHRSAIPACPHCSSEHLEKKLSVFSANGKAADDHVHTGPGCGCGNPQGPCNL